MSMSPIGLTFHHQLTPHYLHTRTHCTCSQTGYELLQSEAISGRLTAIVGYFFGGVVAIVDDARGCMNPLGEIDRLGKQSFRYQISRSIQRCKRNGGKMFIEFYS